LRSKFGLTIEISRKRQPSTVRSEEVNCAKVDLVCLFGASESGNRHAANFDESETRLLRAEEQRTPGLVESVLEVIEFECFVGSVSEGRYRKCGVVFLHDEMGSETF